jgi:two-component system phosphate regulon sensor histidine kinase PhoR
VLASKNLSVSTLAFICSILFATLVAIAQLFFFKNWIQFAIITSLILISSYAIVYYVINQFVYRKIKIIYKLIAQTKATKREEFYNNEILQPKNLDDVNEEVNTWVAERKQEIEKLESNEQFRKQFLMNLAHELKTPIFSIQGYIHTLLDGALYDNNVNMKFLETAAKSTYRLVNLVADVDVISKLESNEIPLQYNVFSVQELLHELFIELQQKAIEKNITLSIKKGCEGNIDVHADKEKIKQVLINLLVNAIKYGKSNGKVTCGIYVIDKEKILVEITDNGIGIAEDSVNRVFERFFRTDEARTRKEGGTGLGLAIAKHIIEAHHQSIQCRSTIDVGTSFSFTLNKA